MAAFRQQRRVPEGQLTQTIYGLIRDQKFNEAIEVLQQEQQVGYSMVGLGVPRCPEAGAMHEMGRQIPDSSDKRHDQNLHIVFTGLT
jgi:hypothetical protein